MTTDSLSMGKYLFPTQGGWHCMTFTPEERRPYFVLQVGAEDPVLLRTSM